MTDLSDAALVARVRAGNRQAFGALVERYQDQMLAYVRYMGFNGPEALDVVQDGFVRAFRHIGRCGNPDKFDGWLFRIVSNLCRTAGKSKARRAADPLDAHRSSLISDAPGPEEHAESSRLRELVRAALDTIPPDQREALVLMYTDGYSVDEIAELTGASRSAVKMRLKRGRDALKVELAPLVSEVEES
ncbi:MAG TPA: RNA polymerase sigma factor [Candidatus Limnocylindrales bacterium]|nr:RNA polymerase sigma factor [Candidatus Limnocylindrales bacterium]